MNENLEKIRKARSEFQESTFFMANYLKCNFTTFIQIQPLFQDGSIPNMGLRLHLDETLPEGEIRIGMGDGPTYATTKI